MEAVDDNPKGFFESKAVYQLHEELLLGEGSSWSDIKPFPRAFTQPSKAEAYRARLRDILLAEYGDSSLFVIKDPRICRLFPLWKQLLDEMDVQPFAVHILRSPVAVAASLQERNQFSPEYSYLLWLRHVLDAEHDSRDCPRIFVSYDGLLADWKPIALAMAKQFKLSWPKSIRKAEAAAFLTSELRHHKQASQDIPGGAQLMPWVRDVNQILQQWISGGENTADFAKLDSIRNAFDISTRAYGALIYPPKKASAPQRNAEQRQAEVTDAQLTLATAMVKALTKERDAVQAENTRLTSDLGRHAQAISDQKIELAKTRGDLIEQTSRADANKIQLQSAQGVLGMQAQQCESLEVRLSDASKEQARLENQISHQKTVLSQQQKLVVQLQKEKGREAQEVVLLSRWQHQAKIKIERAQIHINEMQASTSWRLTRPLRWIRQRWGRKP